MKQEVIADFSPTHNPFSRRTNHFNTEVIKLKRIVDFFDFFGNLVMSRLGFVVVHFDKEV